MHYGSHRPPSSNDPSTGHADNVSTLVVTGLSVAVIAIFASWYPAALVPAIFAKLAMWAALASAGMALLFSQHAFSRELNLWDKAMFLCFASLVAAAFIDAEAIEALAAAASQPEFPNENRSIPLTGGT